MRFVADNQQSFEGYIDALIDTGETLVIADHKTYAGADPIGRIEEEYLGQMESYREAVQAMTGRPVRTFIHMPLLGEIYEVKAG